MLKRTMIYAVLALSSTACSGSILDPTELRFTQVDFTGRPAISTVFLPSSQKDSYNLSQPSEQRATFKSSVTDFLMNVAGYTASDADALANVLIPDILTVDLNQIPSGYLNGRTPSDDVVTASLTLVFGPGTPLSDDNVDDNDKLLPTTFPFLAEPHL